MLLTHSNVSSKLKPKGTSKVSALCYSPYTVLLVTLRTIALSCTCLSEISPSNPIKQLKNANVAPLHPLLGPEERALPYT